MTASGTLLTTYINTCYSYICPITNNNKFSERKKTIHFIQFVPTTLTCVHEYVFISIRYMYTYTQRTTLRGG